MSTQDNYYFNLISFYYFIPSFIFSSLNINNFNSFIKKFLIFSFLFLLISSQILIECSAIPTTTTTNIIKTIILPVGSIFIFKDPLVNELDFKQQLPLWIKIDLQNGTKRLFGIPQIKDIGKYQLMLKDGRQSLLIEVTEQQPSPCPHGSAPIWLEVLDPREYQRISIEEQLKLAESFLSNIHKSDASFIRLENFRIFPYIYLDKFRTVNAQILSAPVITNTSLLTLILNISCGELTEQASEVISIVADQGLVFRIIEGSLIKSKEEIEQIKTNNNNIIEEKNKENNQINSFLIIGIILFIILILFIGILIFRWFRIKQQEKRRKQFLDLNKNGTRPSTLNNNDKNNNNKNNISSIISPDSSMKTLTTPMLEGNENEEIKETKIINGNK
ncbi:hypothetical protein Mgra_00006391 [Meloidogyne graminicola]|uniref:Transmembrane protein n=1 Tax=Meloidogyne graminicola TaxID=189291 RepID=A0A8S9ZLU6_9BILA|nr:hypothetical protein Mgra_00006391 [Meloidogyne graminicola]